MDNNLTTTVIPARRSPDTTGRAHTVIPTPRSNGMFPGWGVRF